MLRVFLAISLQMSVCLSYAADDFRVVQSTLDISWPNSTTIFLYEKKFLNTSRTSQDFTYAAYFSGDNGFESVTTSVTKASGEESLRKVACKESDAIGGMSLHSDRRTAVWALSDVEPGSTVHLKYILRWKVVLPFIPLRLDDTFAVDTTLVKANPPAGYNIEFIPRNVAPSPFTNASKNFSAGQLEVWKEKAFGGTGTVAGPRLDIRLIPKSPGDWCDVVEEIQSWWSTRNLKIGARDIAKDEKEILNISVTDMGPFENFVRYVSIPIGKHDFVPDEPKAVIKRRYGDCKDLSVLCCELLRENGIQAVPVLVNIPSSDPFDPTLPTPFQFNHCIVGIPGTTDTIFYDATTRGYPVGSLPWSVQGCWALWLDDVCGLTKIPVDSTPILVKRSLVGELTSNWSAQGRLRIEADPRLPDIGTDLHTSDDFKSIMLQAVEASLSASISDSVSSTDYSIEGNVSVSGWGRTIGKKVYLKARPFQATFPKLPESDIESGYFTGRPLVVSEVMALKLPIAAAPGVLAIDSFANDVGAIAYRIEVIGDSLIGTWRHGFLRDHLESERKTELEQYVRFRNDCLAKTVALEPLSP